MKKSFQQRLRELRGDSTRVEFAKFLGINPKTYEHYELGSRNPTIALLLQLAAKCSVTVDFLLGLSDVGPAVPQYVGTEGGDFCHGCRVFRALEKRVAEIEKKTSSP